MATAQLGLSSEVWRASYIQPPLPSESNTFSSQTSPQAQISRRSRNAAEKLLPTNLPQNRKRKEPSPSSLSSLADRLLSKSPPIRTHQIPHHELQQIFAC